MWKINWSYTNKSDFKWTKILLETLDWLFKYINIHNGKDDSIVLISYIL